MESGSGIVGFDYYLRKLREQQSEARSEAPIKLVIALDRAPAGVPLLELAATSGMEIVVFMDAVTKMQDAKLISLTGSSEAPEKILIALTPAGRNVASVVVQRGN